MYRYRRNSPRTLCPAVTVMVCRALINYDYTASIVVNDR